MSGNGANSMIQKIWALALSIEAAELNELFLWKKESDSEEVNLKRLREELADVFAYAIMLAGRHGLEVSEIVKEKIEKMPEISRRTIQG